MPVITISRDAGSFGDEIADSLSEKRGYSLLGPESIVEKLRIKGIERPVIEHFDEKDPGFLTKFSDKRDKYIQYLKLIILEECIDNKLVLLGLGGPFLFNSHDSLIRVKVTAPQEIRVERIAEKYECDKILSRRLINQVDHDRMGYAKGFFGKDYKEFNSYDLILNTEYMSIYDGVRLIEEMIRIKENNDDDFIAELVVNKAAVKILYEKKIPVKNLILHYENGLLIIEGQTGSMEDRDLCSLFAGEIDEVEDILNKISYKPLGHYKIQ
ncbi:MAG: cytidylate kinase-like family protein [Spirochaetaceae bacterium]|nr:cytidylate kinase-like family protein [Spirochaetaceae bacterium]